MANPRRNWIAEVALVVAGIAFSGMGVFLVQWGQAQERINKIDERGSSALFQHDQKQVKLDREVQKKLSKLNTRTLRMSDVLDSVAKRLDVPVPAREEEP